MEKVVIDTYALAALLNKEKNYKLIVAYLKEWQLKKVRILITTVNFGEIYYIVLRTKGEEAAEALLGMITAIPVELFPVTQEVALQAARYKAFKKMSYADCFAAALAKLEKCAVLTGDKEFKEVEKEIKIIWV